MRHNAVWNAIAAIESDKERAADASDQVARRESAASRSQGRGCAHRGDLVTQKTAPRTRERHDPSWHPEDGLSSRRARLCDREYTTSEILLKQQFLQLLIRL